MYLVFLLRFFYFIRMRFDFLFEFILLHHIEPTLKVHDIQNAPTKEISNAMCAHVLDQL